MAKQHPAPRNRTPLIVWALILLAVAFPAAIGPVAGFTLAVAAFALGHLTATCTVTAAVLLIRAAPRTARALATFLGVGAIASLAAVRPA